MEDQLVLFLAELVGTAILVILGDGVVANVVLSRTKGNNSGWIVITTGWGIAVAIAVYCVGRISGGHINPAVTLGMASIGNLGWELVPVYIAGQMLGGILGGVVVYLAYLPHWAATPDPAAKLGVFCNAPAIRSDGANLLCEFIGTGVLVFAALAIGANVWTVQSLDASLAPVFSTGLNPLILGFLVWGIGLSLGGPTGYAINPARDLGPRIAHAILPIAGKGDSDWRYAWIPVLGPVAGGVAGALIYQFGANFVH